MFTDLNSGNVPGEVIENICNIEPGQWGIIVTERPPVAADTTSDK